MIEDLIFFQLLRLWCLKCLFYPQHLFPDADQDLDDLEIEQQELLFNKMENSKDAKHEQVPQVWKDFVDSVELTLQVTSQL